MTREEVIDRLKEARVGHYEFLSMETLNMAIKALEQEPCDVFDEYGNYKYPSDVELTEPNTATSMPCEDAISRQAYIERYRKWGYSEFGRKVDNEELAIRVAMSLPPVNPQPKTGQGGRGVQP